MPFPYEEPPQTSDPDDDDPPDLDGIYVTETPAKIHAMIYETGDEMRQAVKLFLDVVKNRRGDNQ